MISNTTASTSMTGEHQTGGTAKHCDLSSRIHYRRCLDTHRREERRRARRKAREAAAPKQKGPKTWTQTGKQVGQKARGSDNKYQGE